MIGDEVTGCIVKAGHRAIGVYGLAMDAVGYRRDLCLEQLSARRASATERAHQIGSHSSSIDQRRRPSIHLSVRHGGDQGKTRLAIRHCQNRCIAKMGRRGFARSRSECHSEGGRVNHTLALVAI